MKSQHATSTLKSVIAGMVAAFAFGGFTSATAAERPGEGVTVKPAVATWSSAIPVSWVYVELLEDLGYEVRDPVALSNPVAFLAVAEGDVAYFPNTWLPVHEPQLPGDFRDKATVFDAFCPACGIQGYLVDKASIEKYDIEGISDIVENDDVRSAFDHNGDGKAEIYGCPPGWGCHEAINKMIAHFELGDVLNHVDAGYSANFAEVVTHVDSGNPVLYYTWGPSAWMTRLEPGKQVMFVNVPGIIDSDAERGKGVKGATTDPIEMGFPPNDIQVSANNTFLEANPAAAELFRQVRIPLSWISKTDAEMKERDLEDDEVKSLAREWLDNNREQTDKWLDAARAAAE